jgi:hypothetical protein
MGCSIAASGPTIDDDTFSVLGCSMGVSIGTAARFAVNGTIVNRKEAGPALPGRRLQVRRELGVPVLIMLREGLISAETWIRRRIPVRRPTEPTS